MKKAIALAAILGLMLLPSSKAQTTYTQTAPVMCRSGELNCIAVGLKDRSGTLRGDYTLECNTNAINNFTCHFTLVLDGLTYSGKVTQVMTYFPVNDADSDDSGPFAYNWSAGSLTGSSSGQGHWGGCGLGRGYCAYINSSTVTVN